MIVEDELLIANYLKDVLAKEGFSIAGIAMNTEKAIELFRKHSPDVVCMDIKLKNGDSGIETARKLRALGEFSLIFLTAYGMRDLVIEAQETMPAGFLVKPVTDQTIIATITTAVCNAPRLREKALPSVYHVETADSTVFEFDLSKGTVRFNHKNVSLTNLELRLLSLLLERKGEVVPFNVLRNFIWPDCSVGEASLKTLIWRIRAKLDYDIIATVPGFGYSIESIFQGHDT